MTTLRVTHWGPFKRNRADHFQGSGDGHSLCFPKRPATSIWKRFSVEREFDSDGTYVATGVMLLKSHVGVLVWACSSNPKSKSLWHKF